MKFKYIQDVTDLIEFNFYFSWTRPERKWMRINLSFLPLSMFCLMLLFSDKPLSEFGFYEAMLIGMGLAAAFFMKSFIKWHNRFRISRFVQKNSSSMLGERYVELTEKHVVYRVGEQTAEILWENIFYLRETELYFYLFVAENQAIILPKSIFDDQGEINAFRKFISRCLQ